MSNRKNIKLHPWITLGFLKKLNSRKLKLYLAYKKDPKNKDKEMTYKFYKNNLNNLIVKTKLVYYKNEVQKNKNDPRKLWKTKNIFTNKIKGLNSIKKINDKGVEITGDKEIADGFNNYFTEAGQRLAECISKPTTSVIKRNFIGKLMFFNPTDVGEVERVVGELDPNRAPVWDKISTRAIKLAINIKKSIIPYNQ